MIAPRARHFLHRAASAGLALAALGCATAALAASSGAVAECESRVRQAQAAGDVAAVKQAAESLRLALGDRAGQPEGGEPKRVKTAGLAPPTAATVSAYLERYRERNGAAIQRIIATVKEPTQQNAGLRNLACLIIADAQSIAAGEQPRDTYRSEMVRAADALCSVQREGGLFPFPDIRQKSEFFGRLIGDLLAKHPEALVDGWLVSDGGRGDLQYDNGLCGVALLEAYTLTTDKKYLAAAQRSAGWVRTQTVVTNWNYNAFSVWFLARLAIVTSQREWLDEAVRRGRLGLLPGQMADGRWIDPHNAKLVYHAILCRALVELVVAGQQLDAADAAIERAAVAGLDNAAREILTLGVSVVTVPTEVFSQALLRWRDDRQWRDALTALAAAAFTPGATESEIGLYAAAYLEYVKRR